jgi:hypothetical protein
MIEEMKPNGPDDDCGMKKINIDFFHPICPNLNDDSTNLIYCRINLALLICNES